MNYKDEIFKDIPGWEGAYMVSNYGRVKSLSTYNSSNPNGRILKIRVSRDGYSNVVLSRNSKPKYVTVHRLVMLAFIGPSDLHVNHKDENKMNNRLDNLEYVNRRYNRIYSLKKSSSASRYVGITKNKGMWVARVQIENKRKHIGRFKTEDEAYNAYVEYLSENNIPLLKPRKNL